MLSYMVSSFSSETLTAASYSKVITRKIKGETIKLLPNWISLSPNIIGILDENNSKKRLTNVIPHKSLTFLRVKIFLSLIPFMQRIIRREDIAIISNEETK